MFKDELNKIATGHYQWIIACGGTETPFTYEGKTYTYMWCPATREHAYYCHEDDTFYADYVTREIH